MAHFSDELHSETCRGKNCNQMAKRSEMVKASKVRGQKNARGYYFQSCADRLTGSSAVLLYVDGIRVHVVKEKR